MYYVILRVFLLKVKIHVYCINVSCCVFKELVHW